MRLTISLLTALAALAVSSTGQSAQPQSQPTTQPAAQPTTADLRPPPLLSKSDILRLRLSEIDLDGPPEKLRVRFHRSRTLDDLEEVVQKQIESDPDADPAWRRTLKRGKPNEKLHVILNATGLQHIQRIELRGDTQVFARFRRRVLPLVLRGCVRSGCHGGATAKAFRLPSGSKTNDAFVYTAFALLDQMETDIGPMIDRALPESSALLRYLLPPDEQGRHPHPKVRRGKLLPVFKGVRDPKYVQAVRWISSLRVPHPEYRLKYEPPKWLDAFRPEAQSKKMPQSQPATEQP